MKQFKIILAKINLKHLFLFIIVIGVLLRILAASRGHNFDMESYWLVGDILNSGGNVYAETRRYNYGPVWFMIIGYFHKISVLFDDPFTFFRYAIALLLTFVDIGIAFWLKKHFGYKAAVLFFLNPISIIITGAHSQFDNLAVYIGMLGVDIYSVSKGNRINFIKALLVIGLSITTKHILFMLPLWLFIREKGFRRKFAALIIPITLFILSFLPFWNVGHEGIIKHVFLYRSFNNSPLLSYGLPPFIGAFISGQVLFGLALSISAFIFRKLNIQKAFLFYTAVLVVFSSAITNQYLAIIVPFISVYFNPVFLLYTVVAAIFLAGDRSGLNIFMIRDNLPGVLVTDISKGRVYNIPIVIAFLGLIYTGVTTKGIKPIRILARAVKQEVKTQLQQLKGKS